MKTVYEHCTHSNERVITFFHIPKEVRDRIMKLCLDGNDCYNYYVILHSTCKEYRRNLMTNMKRTEDIMSRQTNCSISVNTFHASSLFNIYKCTALRDAVKECEQLRNIYLTHFSSLMKQKPLTGIHCVKQLRVTLTKPQKWTAIFLEFNGLGLYINKNTGSVYLGEFNIKTPGLYYPLC